MNEFAKPHRGALAIGIAWCAAIALLSLGGCYSPHIVNEQDALYCEAEGLPAGTNANVDCAIKHEAEREQAGGSAADQTSPKPQAPVGPPAPPAHAGGVSQITPRSVAPGTTGIINFSISVNSDCIFTGMPTVRIDKQPKNGIATVVPLIDFARLSQNGFASACADKKISGISVQYTPSKDYVGSDLMEFVVMTRQGSTAFKAPITVQKPSDDDD